MELVAATGPIRAGSGLRLRVKRDFERVLRDGRKRGGQWLSIHYLPNGQVAARLGIIAPKRWIRLAVGRNAAKRILRESFRRELPGLPAVDVVLRIRTTWNREQKAALANDARTLLRSCLRS
jgi:ribonuclease P protein component